MTTAVSGTYEATKAAESISHQPDPIHWQRNTSFRDSQYRQLHHQKGICGIFSCRLLEASDIRRVYWSALALGPVKHLGLSKAHGAVSSFCSFSMTFRDHESKPAATARAMKNDGDRKPAARKMEKKPAIVSPVVAEDNNPVWYVNLPLVSRL